MNKKNILNKIVINRKACIEKKKKNISDKFLQRLVDPPRQFFQKNGNVTLIAECKKGSPSKGVFLDDYDPVSISKQYAKGGAHAISVITEPDFFYGDDSHLRSVRQNVSLPVLRKDFIFDPYQIKESWAIGADAILLIAAIACEELLTDLASYAAHLGLEALLEVHSMDELEKALKIPVSAIGINARNLKNFTIDLQEAKRLCNFMHPDKIAVAESGMKSPHDGTEMYNAGFRGFLVGEYFISSPSDERESRVREFLESLK